MNGTTPTARAKHLEKFLKSLYDRYGNEENVTDMLTDLRHLCDLRGYDFAQCDRTAISHYRTEIEDGRITPAQKKKRAL